MKTENNNNEKTELRIIKTARTTEAINEAVEKGFWPLVKPVVPSPEIRVKFAIKQDQTTGKITVCNDFREVPVRLNISGQERPPLPPDVVIDWTYYYPYQFESPFAAYLIPPDLKVGELVILEDLIEDIVGAKWNQGDTYRLKCCQAVWNGKEFVLQHDPSVIGSAVG